MRDARKVFGYVALGVIAVLACLELAHWSDERIDLVSEDTERILRLTPAAAITGEERTMMDALSAHPAVREMLESGEGYVDVSENPNVMDIVADCLGPENAALAIALPNEEGAALVLDWRAGKDIALLQKKGTEYFKVYSRDGLFGTRSIYENWDNERVRQSVAHHWWFSWLTADW